jgi:hypothetical protein
VPTVFCPQSKFGGTVDNEQLKLMRDDIWKEVVAQRTSPLSAITA